MSINFYIGELIIIIAVFAFIYFAARIFTRGIIHEAAHQLNKASQRLKKRDLLNQKENQNGKKEKAE